MKKNRRPRPEESALPQVSRRLAEARKRRARHRLWLGAAVAVAMAAALFYITGLYGESIVLLGDVVDTVSIALKPGPGWPAATGMPDAKQAESMTGGFAVLGEDDVALFSNHGALLRRISHGYARPAMAVSKTRFCLYGRTGTELRVENRSRTLYTRNFDQPILTVAMGADDSVGVITRSARYTGEVYVYNGQFTGTPYRLLATEAEGTPFLLDFSPVERRLAVGCLSPKGGVMGANILVLDTGSEKPVAQVRLDDFRLYKLEWLSGDSFAALGDGKCAVYDYRGREKAVYSYAGRALASADVEGKNLLLLFEDGSLVLLDEKLQPMLETREKDCTEVVLTKAAAYCLSKDAVHGISYKGKDLGTQTFASRPLALVRGKQTMVLWGGRADVLALVPPPEETNGAKP